MDAIVLLGAPGAGKGTVAEDIRNAVHFSHVSTGDMLRSAIKAEKPLGLEAKRFMERGELVPDDVILKLVNELIESGSTDARYMFDGFPRTTAQAEKFDEVLAAHGARVRFVFLLEVPREVLIRRICGRRICRACGAVYNIHTKRPKVEGVCDMCGSTDIYQRADDTEATLNNRLDVFERQTAELIDYYEKVGVLVRVDAVDRLATEEAIIRYLKG
ncbi:MAG TPA: adenylate kinase [Kiritimatiellia bacterium]|nr:adenylate kinase [Kiritimatiellia bacterium]HMO98842.1 adenylate kinase [Kiritimatiellia bacterium]HMP96210.1 adenylate kinase [Kiritimatiellia bacterium]